METLKPRQPDDTMQGILLDFDSEELIPGKVIPLDEQEEVEEEVHVNE
jgi:hypothetical protein